MHKNTQIDGLMSLLVYDVILFDWGGFKADFMMFFRIFAEALTLELTSSLGAAFRGSTVLWSPRAEYRSL